MAKNFRCWVIVAGSLPTAFRARDPEDLLPTLKQLQRTQPDIEMMWFERGKVWPSPEDALRALDAQRRAPKNNGRGRTWRPGGEHKDPRARPLVPRDEKRALFKKRLIAKKTRGADGAPAAGGDRRRPPAPSSRRPSSGPPRRRNDK